MKQKLAKGLMRIYDGDKKLDNAAMERLFLKQLDNIYCIKKHLVKVLPSLADQASFPELKAAILENADVIKLQILRMDVIYKMFNTSCIAEDCLGVKTLSLETYNDTQAEGQLLLERDLNLLIHLQIIESIETAYFKVLNNIAGNLNNNDVEILLDQNFESAADGKMLYELIAKEYIS